MAMIIFGEDNSIPNYIYEIFAECSNGITLADPSIEDMPIMYANAAFEKLTGYNQEEIIGRNCRFLQGKDTEQEAKKIIKEGIRRRQPVEVVIRNYRKNGEMFNNKLKMKPLFNDQGELIYFLGIQLEAP